jgi:DNA-binding IclR family transcriptional regulator
MYPPDLASLPDDPSRRSTLPHNGAPPPRSLVSRITAILLTFHSGNAHSVTEIARLTGLPVSTAHRLTAELASWQLLRRVPDGRYVVGVNLQRLRQDVDSVPGPYDRAPLVVTDLCEATRRRARLGVLLGGRVAYIEKRVGAEPPTPLCVSASLPAHATALGKALLAFAPRETVAFVERRLTAHTASTCTDPASLQHDLRTIRRTRLAQARGELRAGDCAVAAPVFGAGGAVVAALELQVQDLTADVEVCRTALAVATRGLSRELALGCQDHGRHLRALPRPSTIPDSTRVHFSPIGQ